MGNIGSHYNTCFVTHMVSEDRGGMVLCRALGTLLEAMGEEVDWMHRGKVARIGAALIEIANSWDATESEMDNLQRVDTLVQIDLAPLYSGGAVICEIESTVVAYSLDLVTWLIRSAREGEYMTDRVPSVYGVPVPPTLQNNVVDVATVLASICTAKSFALARMMPEMGAQQIV